MYIFLYIKATCLVLFVHVVDEEQMISSSQLAIFVRQWHPATVELENFKEIFLTQQTVEELKSKVHII